MVFSEADLTITATGTQWGKSQAASLWLKRKIHMHTGVADNFLVLAPTYKILNQSALPYFLNCMDGMGKHNKADAEFKIRDGGTVYFRTGTDPDSVVGIPNLKAYWLDEAGKASLYFWENIQARAASQGAKGLLTTSPYSLNWLYKDYIKPIQKGLLPEVPLIQAASWENPYHSLHDPIKREAQRRKMDKRRFDMIFGGEWGLMQGLVYDCFDFEENIVEPFKLPIDTKYFAGIDWGYTQPFSLEIRAITPNGEHFKVSEFHKTQQSLSDIIQICKQKDDIFNIECFWCGPDQPGYIEELNRAGLPAAPADNDVKRGIALHYELIKTRKFMLFKGQCPHTLDEIETYHYPEPNDLRPDQDVKDQNPVKQNDHSLDASRYCTIMTYTGVVDKRAPKTGETKRKKNETYEERMKRLTRRPNPRMEHF